MVIQLNSQVIWYEKSGEGDPVILLHGNQESHEIFDELAAGSPSALPSTPWIPGGTARAPRPRKSTTRIWPPT